MYEFNVNIYGRFNLEVVADSREEAERMVKDVLDNSKLKEMFSKDMTTDEITINRSEVISQVNNKKPKDMER